MNLDDIDWTKIANSLPIQKDTRLTTAPLTQMDWYLEKVWTEASNRSLAADTQSLIMAQLKQQREERLEAIAFLAAQHGISFEECFVRLAKGEPLSNE